MTFTRTSPQRTTTCRIRRTWLPSTRALTTPSPSALLCTALTSIPRVNKTDVETLRASFGVRPLSPLSSSSPLVYIHLTITYRIGTAHTQSFAKMAQADAAQLARLPGFGPKKVARLKDAFERPFRTGTTSALALAAPSTSAPAPAPASSASTKPPLPAPALANSDSTSAQSHVWDIEPKYLSLLWPHLWSLPLNQLASHTLPQGQRNRHLTQHPNPRIPLAKKPACLSRFSPWAPSDLLLRFL
jgi:hypothetical protein